MVCSLNILVSTEEYSNFQIQNSLLLPIYSFGHTYIQFVFKYNNIHT